MNPAFTDGLEWFGQFPPADGRCLVVFGGIRSGVGLPPFEFKRLLAELELPALLVRDLDQHWYQGGVRGLCVSLAELGSALDALLEAAGVDDGIFVGNSAGGFGAIAAGSTSQLCRKVIAFSPQTFIGPLNRIRHRDFRWPMEIVSTYVARRGKASLWDLRDLDTLPATQLYFSSNHRLDAVHAERLRDRGAVCAGIVSTRGHELVGELRASGELAGLLRRSFDELQP